MEGVPLKPKLNERTLISLICICDYVNQPTASYPMAADLPAEEPLGLGHSGEDWIMERDICVKTGPSCIFRVHQQAQWKKVGFNPSLSERQDRGKQCNNHGECLDTMQQPLLEHV